MSGTYRMQPPSPFPYSGGSRMEQALVPALQGPNSNSMIGYALGAQLQRQADQMGYEREMDEYNLTTQQEAQRVQEQQLADRQEQRRSALTNALVSSGGAGYLPEDYELTPRQRELATADTAGRIALRNAQAERVGRGGTSTGAGTTRPDPYTLREFGSALTDERQAATALARLNDPNTRARAIATATRDIYDPAARARAVTEVDTALAQAREAAQARIAGIAERRTALRPGGTPAAAAPAGNATPAQPQAAPAPAGGGTAAPATAAPAAASTATPEVRARALAAQSGGTAGRMPDGSLAVRMPDGSVRKVD